jgi:hypothetical protein
LLLRVRAPMPLFLSPRCRESLSFPGR